MSFELNLVPLITVFVVGIVLTVAALAFAAVDGVRRNRPVRLARHESVGHYYGQLLLGH